MLQIAELIAIFVFFWTFGKVQMDVNARHDGRLDSMEKHCAVIIEQQNFIAEHQKYLLDMVSDRLELFEGKLNFMNASLNSWADKTQGKF